MDDKKLKEVIEYLHSLTPQQHAIFFKEIKGITAERMKKEIENWQCQAKEIEDFVVNAIGK